MKYFDHNEGPKLKSQTFSNHIQKDTNTLKYAECVLIMNIRKRGK